LSILDRIYEAIVTAVEDIKQISSAVQINSGKLDQILSILNEPAPPVGAAIKFKENEMTKLQHNSKSKMKFVLNDNGTATGTITFVDASGAPTQTVVGATVATTATSSDPGVTVSVDPTGLIVTAAPASPLPLPLPQGVVISFSITITNPDGSTIGPLTCDNSADPLNVTAGGPAGAHITFA